MGGNFLIYLLKKNFNVVVIDNFSNSSRHNFFILKNKLKSKGLNFVFYEGCIGDNNLVNQVFSDHEFDNIYHFAALKSVPDSLKKPCLYLNNNFYKSKTFIERAIKSNIKNFIFSSSATVYGEADNFPIKENSPLSYKNPYGLSKILTENYLKKLSHTHKKIKFTILRYFNPLGSVFDNIYPEFFDKNSDSFGSALKKIISQNNEEKNFKIYGNDYKTSDGSPVRDFIHLKDLLDGHFEIINKYELLKNLNIFNLGTGKGITIINFLNIIEKIKKIKINYIFLERRKGDISVSYADVNKIKHQIGWKSKLDYEDICEDI